MTNASHRVLYTGVTNDLGRRIYEHKNNKGSSFASKYHVHYLVYYEQTSSIMDAIQREKQLKAGSRKKKIDLIISMNPEWKDLWEEMNK